MGIFDLYENQKLEKISQLNREANEQQLELLEKLININSKILLEIKEIKKLYENIKESQL